MHANIISQLVLHRVSSGLCAQLCVALGRHPGMAVRSLLHSWSVDFKHWPSCHFCLWPLRQLFLLSCRRPTHGTNNTGMISKESPGPAGWFRPDGLAPTQNFPFNIEGMHQDSVHSEQF